MARILSIFVNKDGYKVNILLLASLMSLLFLFTAKLFIGVPQAGGSSVPKINTWDGPEVQVSITAKEYVSPVTSCEAYRDLVSQYKWNVEVALRVMKAESGCNPLKHNWTDRHKTCLGSYGLFQIGCVHKYSVTYLEDQVNNIAAAYKIYLSQGWNAWINTCKKVGCY